MYVSPQLLIKVMLKFLEIYDFCLANSDKLFSNGILNNKCNIKNIANSQ